ncbi:MAG TPA: RsmD family RNA methyltransferase [Bacteroidales bacterium]|nr:RsmD family RNA methyltransferase [Bacteroidales bacterium]
MRIISGTHKGRIIHPDKSFRARPTTDIARESLFNILVNNFDLESIRVLDLFSGTGSITYEFASRGCPQIDLVEKNYYHYRFIKRMLGEMGFNQVKTWKTDVFTFIEHTPDQYDLIFADPPYDMPGIDTLPGLIEKHNLLAEDGWFILEHSKNLNFSAEPEFRMLRNYGSVHFSIFGQKKSEK